MRFREHLCASRIGTGWSKFAEYLREQGHLFTPINEIISVIIKVLKGRHVDTNIKYHMDQIVKLDIELNDKHNESLNLIFEVSVN